MPFERPTLQQIIDRGIVDVEANLTGSDPRLRRSPESVLVKVLSGAAHQLHGHQVYLSKQILPDTQGEEMLLRSAALHLTPPRKQATFAGGEITMTGGNGTSVPQYTEWTASNGVVFRTDALIVVAGGVAVLNVTAMTTGQDGNIATGSPLTIGSPIAGLDSDATVTAADGTLGGTDIETIEEVRSRLLSRLQTPPTSGGPGDYVAWAEEVPGVTRAWQIANYNGAGTVGVFFVRDNDTPITPDAGEVAEVLAYILARAPVTANVNVYVIVLVPMALTIALTPDTPAIRLAVEAQLEDMFIRDAEPGETTKLSRIGEAISLAEGEESHVRTVPAADVTHAASEIPTLGAITWV